MGSLLFLKAAVTNFRISTFPPSPLCSLPYLKFGARIMCAQHKLVRGKSGTTSPALTALSGTFSRQPKQTPSRAGEHTVIMERRVKNRSLCTGQPTKSSVIERPEVTGQVNQDARQVQTTGYCGLNIILEMTCNVCQEGHQTHAQEMNVPFSALKMKPVLIVHLKPLSQSFPQGVFAAGEMLLRDVA